MAAIICWVTSLLTLSGKLKASKFPWECWALRCFGNEHWTRALFFNTDKNTPQNSYKPSCKVMSCSSESPRVSLQLMERETFRVSSSPPLWVWAEVAGWVSLAWLWSNQSAGACHGLWAASAWYLCRSLNGCSPRASVPHITGAGGYRGAFFWMPKCGAWAGLERGTGDSADGTEKSSQECHPGDLSAHPRQPLVCSFLTLRRWISWLQGPFHSCSRRVA